MQQCRFAPVRYRAQTWAADRATWAMRAASSTRIANGSPDRSWRSRLQVTGWGQGRELRLPNRICCSGCRPESSACRGQIAPVLSPRKAENRHVGSGRKGMHDVDENGAQRASGRRDVVQAVAYARPPWPLSRARREPGRSLSRWLPQPAGHPSAVRRRPVSDEVNTSLNRRVRRAACAKPMEADVPSRTSSRRVA